jgi:Protein of unknown function (DUF2971)
MESEMVGRNLYRILSFDRLVQILRTNRWFFAHPASWEDPYERRHASPLTDKIYAQCWCRNGVSDAMWRIYSPSKLGVRIRVDAVRFNESLAEACESQGVKFRIGGVRYVNAMEELIDTPPTVSSNSESNASFLAATDHLFLKRLAFSHEAEVRVVLLSDNKTNGKGGQYLNLNAQSLIQNVLVDPRAPDEYVDAYTALIREEFGSLVQVQKSRLYAEAIKREL